MQALRGRALVKLENMSIGRTKNGLVYQKDLDPQQRYGHIVDIHEDDADVLELKRGDRVLFMKDYVDVIPFKSLETKNYITYILCAVRVDGILAKVPEQYDVMDILGYNNDGNGVN